VCILFTRANVYFTIISYVTVTLIAELQTMYYSAIKNDKNNVLFDMFNEEHRPKIKHRRKDINYFKDRSCNNKFQRFAFKLLRGMFVAVAFYFVPFLFLFVH